MKKGDALIWDQVGCAQSEGAASIGQHSQEPEHLLCRALGEGLVSLGMRSLHLSAISSQSSGRRKLWFIVAVYTDNSYTRTRGRCCYSSLSLSPQKTLPFLRIWGIGITQLISNNKLLHKISSHSRLSPHSPPHQAIPRSVFWMPLFAHKWQKGWPSLGWFECEMFPIDSVPLNTCSLCGCPV